MARLFISYSRKDKDFARKLTDALQRENLDFWIDWAGIPPTAAWMKEVEKGIEEADTFLAIVTPEWISSDVCRVELIAAVRNGKRLIPVVPNEITWDSVPAELAHLNFIFFNDAFDFKEQLNKLLAAINTDYDWLKAHRRLQVRALEWERANREDSFLLRGRDLHDTNTNILSIKGQQSPALTELQQQYIQASLDFDQRWAAFLETSKALAKRDLQESDHQPSPQLKVFLCHSSGDKQVVRKLYQQLRVKKGIDPWLDEVKLLPGVDWNREISLALQESDVVIVCLSKTSINKEGYVQKEIRRALDVAEEKPDGTIFIIPLRVEDCEVPQRLSQWQWVNYYEDGAFERLISALQRRAKSIDIEIG